MQYTLNNWYGTPLQMSCGSVLSQITEYLIRNNIARYLLGKLGCTLTYSLTSSHKMQWLPNRWYFGRCVAQPNIYLSIYKEVNLYNYYFERERDREKVSIMLQNSGILL